MSLPTLIFILQLTSNALSQHVDINDLSSLLSKMESYDKRFVEMEENYKNKVAKLEEDIDDRVAMLEQLARVGTLRSCAEYSRYGLKSSGMYNIDPDGPLLGSEPFQVFCNFETGATEVLHDSENLTVVDHCHDPGNIPEN